MSNRFDPPLFPVDVVPERFPNTLKGNLQALTLGILRGVVALDMMEPGGIFPDHGISYAETLNHVVDITSDSSHQAPWEESW